MGKDERRKYQKGKVRLGRKKDEKLKLLVVVVVVCWLPNVQATG